VDVISVFFSQVAKFNDNTVYDKSNISTRLRVRVETISEDNREITFGKEDDRAQQPKVGTGLLDLSHTGSNSRS